MRRIRVHTNVRAMIMPNKILDKPKLITFDLDHTLWNPDHALQRGEAASYQWLTEQVPAFAQTFSPDSFLALRKQLYVQHPALRHRVSEMRRVATQQALQLVGVSERESIVLSKAAFDIFWALRQQVDLFDETTELLQTLAQHYRVGAISNQQWQCLLKNHRLGTVFSVSFGGRSFFAGQARTRYVCCRPAKNGRYSAGSAAYWRSSCG